jgi:predicted Rossmann-fold nucleotide-binding protein
LLAEAGFAVATGGYAGIMAAVSQGANEAGGVVYGITCTQIEQKFQLAGANQWVTKEIKYATLRERLWHLVMENAGIITLPGGIGTLSEMSLAWSFIQTGELSPRPLALLGDIWANTVHSFLHPDYIPDQHLHLLEFASTPSEAVMFMTTS